MFTLKTQQNLSVIFCTLLLLFLSGCKNDSQYLVKSNYESVSQENISFKRHTIFVDLAIELSNYFTALYAFNNLEKCADINSFLRQQISSFTRLELRFIELSNQLKSLSNEDPIINQICNNCLKFSELSNRYVNLILIVKKDPENLESTAIKTKCVMEFMHSWDEILNLTFDFVNKNLMTADEKKQIISKIKSYFRESIDKFSKVNKEKGLEEAASTLKFENGAWLPIILLLYLEKNEL